MFKFLHKILLTALFAAFASQASAMWIQADTYDPTQPGVGTNRYAYSNNDPVNMSDPSGHSWLDRAWDSIAGEGSFNRTFGDSGSAWSDRNFGNSFEKSYSSYYSDVKSYESTLDYDPTTHGFPNQSYPDSKQGYIENSSLASGRAIASNIDIDIALTASGIGPTLRGGAWIYDGVAASMNPARVFWSGRSAVTGLSARSAAEAYATTNGATTLEMTLSGKILDSVTTKGTFKYLEPLWQRASARFAAGADSATVFRGTSVRQNNVFDTIERPILENRGIQYVISLFE